MSSAGVQLPTPFFSLAFSVTLSLTHTHTRVLSPLAPSLSCQLNAHLSVWFKLDPPYWWLNGRLMKREARKLTFGSPRGWSITRGEKRVRERREKQAVGVAFGVLIMQFPLRGGPPICEWNRQNLAKNGGNWNKKWYGREKWGDYQIIRTVYIGSWISFLLHVSPSLPDNGIAIFMSTSLSQTHTHAPVLHICAESKSLFSRVAICIVSGQASPTLRGALDALLVTVSWGVRWWRMLPAALLVSIFIVSQAAKRPVWNNGFKILWVF